MRLILPLLLFSLAACATTADVTADRAEARAQFVAELQSQPQFPANVRGPFADCMVSAMTDPEVGAFLAAQTRDAKEAVLNSIADRDAVFRCELMLS